MSSAPTATSITVRSHEVKRNMVLGRARHYESLRCHYKDWDQAWAKGQGSIQCVPFDCVEESRLLWSLLFPYLQLHHQTLGVPPASLPPRNVSCFTLGSVTCLCSHRMRPNFWFNIFMLDLVESSKPWEPSSLYHQLHKPLHKPPEKKRYEMIPNDTIMSCAISYPTRAWNFIHTQSPLTTLTSDTPNGANDSDGLNRVNWSVVSNGLGKM